MPYIKQDKRSSLANYDYPGGLNYLITTFVRDYIKAAGGVNYDNINTAIGVLECAKLELYRRIAVPYENAKCEENGDVYGP